MVIFHSFLYVYQRVSILYPQGDAKAGWFRTDEVPAVEGGRHQGGPWLSGGFTS
jgi:hypothetical protein